MMLQRGTTECFFNLFIGCTGQKTKKIIKKMYGVGAVALAVKMTMETLVVVEVEAVNLKFHVVVAAEVVAVSLARRVLHKPFSSTELPTML